MLKALKTLLKDDIINPNTKGGFIMGVQQALTTEQVSILLWLKRRVRLRILASNSSK